MLRRQGKVTDSLETNPHIRKGYGGPVVSDGKVYLLDRDDDVGETLRCLKLDDGKELWSYAYDASGSVIGVS